MQCCFILGCCYVWMGNDSHPELTLAKRRLRIFLGTIAEAAKTQAQPQQVRVSTLQMRHSLIICNCVRSDKLRYNHHCTHHSNYETHVHYKWVRHSIKLSSNSRLFVLLLNRGITLSGLWLSSASSGIVCTFNCLMATRKVKAHLWFGMFYIHYQLMLQTRKSSFRALTSNSGQP